MGKVLGLIIAAWLVSGFFAAFQRDYFNENLAVSCKTGSDILLTVVAGPLNYFDVNPKIDCANPTRPRG